jgi:hypothetical protein
MKIAKMLSMGILVSMLSVATATARAEDAWKDAAMTALLANAEAVLETRQLVTSGRPIFGKIDHRVVSQTPGDGRTTFPVQVEEFVFTVEASFGDALKRVGTFTITQTTTRYPRSPGIAYATKFEPVPAGEIIR